jgi:hypothetical protein
VDADGPYKGLPHFLQMQISSISFPAEMWLTSRSAMSGRRGRFFVDPEVSDGNVASSRCSSQ